LFTCGGEEIIEVIVKLAREEIQLIGLIEERVEESFCERKIKGKLSYYDELVEAV
jgi:hypothetical protein